MKGFILLVLCSISMLTCAQLPKFEADESVHKFPDTREGVLLSHVFTIRNTGDAPLIISEYKVACPCTKVELPMHPILPGHSYPMKVVFDTNGKSEWQDRAILLQTNTKKKEEKLRIKVYVIPAK